MGKERNSWDGISLLMIATDLMWGIALTALVTSGIAVARLVRNAYLGRKIVHMFVGAAGVAVPLVFSDLPVPLLISLIYAVAVLMLQEKHAIRWLEIEGSRGEVYFAVMLPLLLGSTWNFDVWLGVVTLSYMAFGDGVTGIVRWAKHRRRGKWGVGSAAMLVTSTVTGGLIYWYAHGVPGLIAGIIGGVAATLSERVDIIDDNVSIPSLSLPTVLLTYMLIQRCLAPSSA